MFGRKYINPDYDRNSTYRSTYFRYNKPQIGSRYFCAYCGKLLKRKSVTVDHLYPVGRARQSRWMQTRLRLKGIKNINDPENLVAACKRCNQRKGQKMGFWIFRGRLGQYKTLWLIRHFIRMVLLTLAAIYLYQLYLGG